MIPDRRKNLVLGAVTFLVLLGAASMGFLIRIEQMRHAASAAPADLRAGNLKIGGTFPDFTLSDRAGKEHSLREALDGKHFVVVTFHHPDCPCAASCGKLISALGQEGYEDVRVIGILSTDCDDERVLGAISKQMKEGVVTFPILLDRDGAVRKLLGATRTPEVWLLDKDGRIAFYGAPENTLFPEQPNHRNLLKEAVDALRRGEAPKTQRYEPFGCLIE